VKPLPTLLVAAVAGCVTAPSTRARVKALYQYRSYSEAQPERDAAVLAQGERAGADVSGVTFLQDKLPEGLAIVNQDLVVQPGYAHELLGKVAYSTGKRVTKAELIARVKQVAVAAGGDAAIGVFVTDDADFRNAHGVEAVILKLDPRLRRP
jgi:hypothetical protein